MEIWRVLQSNACEEQRNQWEKKMKKRRKLEKASREIANKMKKKKERKKKENRKKKTIFIEAKQLAAQLHVWVAY